MPEREKPLQYGGFIDISECGDLHCLDLEDVLRKTIGCSHDPGEEVDTGSI